MERSDDGFLEGFLVCDVKSFQYPVEVAQWIGDGGLASWDDGFLAFSQGEVRLPGVRDKDMALLLRDKVSGIERVDGYLMEAGLWRSKRGLFYEEVSIDREDRGFFCQRWTLHEVKDTIGVNKKPNCYYREAKTQSIPRDEEKAVFSGRLSSVEVVVPLKRLHFFITVGG